jgi:hypothetical protein
MIARRRRRTILRPLVSLLLPAAVIVVWWRSYGRCDLAGAIGARGSAAMIVSQRGMIAVAVAGFAGQSGAPPAAGATTTSFDVIDGWYASLHGPSTIERRLGPFVYLNAPEVGLFQCPHWALFALTSLPLLRWCLLARRTALRELRGQCRDCGYDLRGGESTRCPECGGACASEPAGNLHTPPRPRQPGSTADAPGVTHVSRGELA